MAKRDQVFNGHCEVLSKQPCHDGNSQWPLLKGCGDAEGWSEIMPVIYRRNLEESVTNLGDHKCIEDQFVLVFLIFGKTESNGGGYCSFEGGINLNKAY